RGRSHGLRGRDWRARRGRSAPPHARWSAAPRGSGGSATPPAAGAPGRSTGARACLLCLLISAMEFDPVTLHNGPLRPIMRVNKVARARPEHRRDAPFLITWRAGPGAVGIREEACLIDFRCLGRAIAG